MCPTPRNPLEKQKEGIRNAGVVMAVTTNCITRARSIRPASTATDRVLATVELLRNIFNHSLRGQNCRNALVSKTWSDEALSVVWYRLESSLPLLTLLGPMSLQEEDGDLNFVRANRTVNYYIPHGLCRNMTDIFGPTIVLPSKDTQGASAG